MRSLGHLRQGRRPDAAQGRSGLAGRRGMMNAQIERYVALHRSFGRKFDAQERWLRLFASYANDLGDRHIQVERIYDWCRSASSQNDIGRAHVCTPVTKAHLVCRLLLENKKKNTSLKTLP